VAPLEGALRKLPKIPGDCQWASFVRNHDELTLDKLSEKERQEVFAAFGPEERHQLYGRGLRRRLPSMLGGDQRRIRMVYSLMFSLPGTPVLLYGEEIGMGENLEIEGRNSVRSPMQWSGSEPHAGFSTLSPDGELTRPLVTGELGPENVNVAAQRRDHDSLLNWMERLIRRRRECPELGWGAFSLIETSEPTIIAHRFDWEDSAVLAVHSLDRKRTQTTLTLDEGDALVDLFEFGELEAGDGGKVTVKLGPYGHRWFRLRRPGRRVPP
jgi:maltose alpha-D-glucosyltransferase/alpha-amylase